MGNSAAGLFIRNVSDPIAVHVFEKKIVVVDKMGNVYEFKREEGS